MKRRILLVILLGALMLLALPSQGVQAHQPYCEYADTTEANPWQVPNASISYAYYGNLYPAADVDYFTFEAEAGQEVLLSLSIPAIEGQDDFAPIMVVSGPEMPTDALSELPERVSLPDDQGALMVPLGDEPVYWFEPFGRRYYWNWENYFFQAPVDATYTVALWHPTQELGRYSFVVGEREVLGGDLSCLASFTSYWTPLVAGQNPYRDTSDEELAAAAADHGTEEGTHAHADGAMHDHGAAIELDQNRAPVVDLQVTPLEDGSYTVRVQTLNFIFAPHHVGHDHMDGEGHAHLYIDDVKVARLYAEWYSLDGLPEGAQTISVALYANNHEALTVDGNPIADSVAVEDLVTSTDDTE